MTVSLYSYAELICLIRLIEGCKERMQVVSKVET